MKKILILIVLLAVVLSQSTYAASRVYKKSALLMGTFVEIQIVHERGMRLSYLNKVAEGAFSEIRNVEKIFNFYDPKSELSKLNEQDSEGFYNNASDEFIFLVKKAKYFTTLTKGAFDVSVAPLEKIWRKACRESRMPEEKEIQDVLESVGMNKIIIDEENNSVRLARYMKLDFGAIATGYAVDKAISYLKKEGIRNALINAGGDIYCLGKGTGRGDWKVAIRNPKEKNSCIDTLVISDRAIATSGSYEKFYTIGNEKFSHIIDPRTGFALRKTPLSVTVLAEDCMTADALSTAIYVLGPEEGMDLVETLESVECIVVREYSGSLVVEKSKGLKEINVSK